MFGTEAEAYRERTKREHSSPLKLSLLGGGAAGRGRNAEGKPNNQQDPVIPLRDWEAQGSQAPSKSNIKVSPSTWPWAGRTAGAPSPGKPSHRAAELGGPSVMSAHEQGGGGGPERALELPRVTQQGVSSHGLIPSSLTPPHPVPPQGGWLPPCFRMAVLGTRSGPCGP